MIESAVHNFETKCKEWFKEKYLPFRGKKIILFGSAAKCEMMIKALSEIGMRENIAGITCNDPEQWGRCRNNIQIISPEEATKIEKSIFIICSKYVNEIASQLDNLEKEYWFLIFIVLHQKQLLRMHITGYKNLTPIKSNTWKR